MDPLSRATEAMLQRAKGNLPGDLRQYAALARKYAVWISDRRPPKKGAPSRLQKHCGRIPDFGDKNGMTPLVFGCKVVRLKDENERIGWKGVGNRAIAGFFVGIEHTSYLVYNAVTRKVTKEPFVWAIDELELARGGLAAGALLHDTEVGDDPVDHRGAHGRRRTADADGRRARDDLSARHRNSVQGMD